MARILIVEDEPNLADGLRDALIHHGHRVTLADNGELGLELALGDDVDLVILDVMLPRLNGLDVCAELRRQGRRMPVLMLTARDREADIVRGFEVGVDDYVTKPFSIKVLVARTQALLRRSMGETDSKVRRLGETVSIGEHVEVHFKRYTLTKQGQEIPLTDRELSLLRYLLERPHEVVRRETLLEAVWGYTTEATTRTVDTFVYRLRQKIERSPRNPVHLLTIRGIGYRLIC